MKITSMAICLILATGMASTGIASDQMSDFNAYQNGRHDGEIDSYAREPASNQLNAWLEYHSGRSNGTSERESQERQNQRYQEEDQNRSYQRRDR